MAKSIYEILDSLQTETSVPEMKDGKGNVVRKNFGSVSHTLPRSILPTAEQFENGEKLLAWAEENGFTHAVLQKGVQKHLIDLRSAFKSFKKDETWSPELGQANVNTYTWTVTERPKTGNNVAKAIDTLSKLDPEQLAAILASLQK